MVWLTEADFNYRMDIASGHYRRKPEPKPITFRNIERFITADQNGRAESTMRILLEAEKRLAASPLIQRAVALLGMPVEPR